jgi:hypothetical protein
MKMTFKVKTKKSEDISYRKSPFTLFDYNQIALKYGLNDKDRYVYTQFMKSRFPNEKCEGYAGEWAGRFKTGQPEVFMDDISRKKFEKAKKMWKEMMKEK